MPLQATSGAASYDGFGGGVAAVPNYIEDVFSTYLYTGNGSTQTITNGIDVSGEGGLVWIKGRNGAGEGHTLFDTVRGVNKVLQTQNVDGSANFNNSLTAFNADGFSLGTNRTDPSVNYVSWTFRKQPKFYTQGTYTGNGTGTSIGGGVLKRDIPHDLDGTVGCVIIKNLDTGNWVVYHRSSAFGTENLRLNTTGAGFNASGYAPIYEVSNTTFSVIVGATGLSSSDNCNINGASYAYYIFAHNAGGFGLTGTDNVISCGSYTGNGSTTGPVINLGYEPQWIMAKKSSGAGDWVMLDNMRGIVTDGIDPRVWANLSNTENTGDWLYKLLPTGFQPESLSDSINASGQTYIYIAIRRGPMKVPTSGTSVLQTLTYTGNGSSGRIYSGVTTVPDLAIATSRSNTSPKNWCDRLRGENPMISTSTNGESGTSQEGKTIIAGSANGTVTFGSYWGDAAVNTNGYTYVNYLLSRAPSFFDEVCYTGTGSNPLNVSHNLGVAPELMIVKSRNTGVYSWSVYPGPLGATSGILTLNQSDSLNTGSLAFNKTAPTSSVFTVGNVATNTSGTTYVAYLFATCAGVSKCTAFTGTGTLQTIDCGFTAGSRFVLIKRTDAAGDWYVWDSSRGLSSSTDPYLLLNSTAAEVTSTNWVDTTSTGFQVTAVSGNNVNINGASYIALAIA